MKVRITREQLEKYAVSLYFHGARVYDFPESIEVEGEGFICIKCILPKPAPKPPKIEDIEGRKSVLCECGGSYVPTFAMGEDLRSAINILIRRENQRHGHE